MSLSLIIRLIISVLHVGWYTYWLSGSEIELRFLLVIFFIVFVFVTRSYSCCSNRAVCGAMHCHDPWQQS